MRILLWKRIFLASWLSSIELSADVDGGSCLLFDCGVPTVGPGLDRPNPPIEFANSISVKQQKKRGFKIFIDCAWNETIYYFRCKLIAVLEEATNSVYHQKAGVPLATWNCSSRAGRMTIYRMSYRLSRCWVDAKSKIQHRPNEPNHEIHSLAVADHY